MLSFAGAGRAVEEATDVDWRPGHSPLLREVAAKGGGGSKKVRTHNHAYMHIMHICGCSSSTTAL